MSKSDATAGTAPGKPEAKADEEAEAKPSDGASGAQRWRDAIEKLRSRVDVTAKALGGIGMTAATAVGIDRIGDLYPVPCTWQSWTWFVLAIVGFVALAGAILFVTYRLWSVNQPVLMRSDYEVMKERGELSDEEAREVGVLYGETARLNGLNDLRAYEARGHRLSRIAARTGEKNKVERERLEKAAGEISGDLVVTFARAAHLVVRRRASDAVRGLESGIAYGVLLAGVLLFALGTDYVSSERTEQVTIAKSCADARTAGATTLPEICGESSKAGKNGDETSPETERAAAATALGEPLQRCLKLIDAGTAPMGSCDPIAEAMSSLVPRG